MKKLLWRPYGAPLILILAIIALFSVRGFSQDPISLVDTSSNTGSLIQSRGEFLSQLPEDEIVLVYTDGTAEDIYGNPVASHQGKPVKFGWTSESQHHLVSPFDSSRQVMVEESEEKAVVEGVSKTLTTFRLKFADGSTVKELESYDWIKTDTRHELIGFTDDNHFLVKLGNGEFSKGLYLYSTDASRRLLSDDPKLFAFNHLPIVAPNSRYIIIWHNNFIDCEDNCDEIVQIPDEWSIMEVSTGKILRHLTREPAYWTLKSIDLRRIPEIPGFVVSGVVADDRYDPNCIIANQPVFRLPFKCGASYYCSRSGPVEYNNDGASCTIPAGMTNFTVEHCGLNVGSTTTQYDLPDCGHGRPAIDFAGEANGDDYLLAVANGKVHKVYYDHATYGNMVIILHAPGVYAFYPHMENGSMLVVVGQDVVQGQWLGKEGDTGSGSTGEHIHFELKTSDDINSSSGKSRYPIFSEYGGCTPRSSYVYTSQNSCGNSTCTDPYEPNNSISSPKTLSLGDFGISNWNQTGTMTKQLCISNNNDEDNFFVTVNNCGWMEVSVTGLSCDVNLYALASSLAVPSGNYLLSGAPGTQSEYLKVCTGVAGFTCTPFIVIRVKPVTFNGGACTNADYTLKLTWHPWTDPGNPCGNGAVGEADTRNQLVISPSSITVSPGSPVTLSVGGYDDINDIVWSIGGLHAVPSITFYPTESVVVSVKESGSGCSFSEGLATVTMSGSGGGQTGTPDYVIDGLDVSASGSDVYIAGTLYNEGTISGVIPVTVGVFLKNNDTGQQYEQTHVVDVSYGSDFDFSLTGLSSGNYTTTVVADVFNGYYETNEGNNAVFSSVTVGGGSTTDLMLSGTGWGPFIPGQASIVTQTVLNNSPATQTFRVCSRQEYAGSILSDLSYTITLGAYQLVTLNNSANIPLYSGTWSFNCTVDCDYVIPEIAEGNNSYSTSQFVQYVPKPNYIICTDLYQGYGRHGARADSCKLLSGAGGNSGGILPFCNPDFNQIQIYNDGDNATSSSILLVQVLGGTGTLLHSQSITIPPLFSGQLYSVGFFDLSSVIDGCIIRQDGNIRLALSGGSVPSKEHYLPVSLGWNQDRIWIDQVVPDTIHVGSKLRLTRSLLSNLDADSVTTSWSFVGSVGTLVDPMYGCEVFVEFPNTGIAQISVMLNNTETCGLHRDSQMYTIAVVDTSVVVSSPSCATCNAIVQSSGNLSVSGDTDMIVVVTNMVGQLLVNQTLSSPQVDVQLPSQGIYFVSWFKSSGHLVQTKKVVWL